MRLGRDDRVPASIELGGVTLWSTSQALLDAALIDVQDTIEAVLGAHLTVARQVLEKLVRDRLNEPTLEDRVIGAVLGLAMRLGKVDALVCGSKNDKPYRVYILAAHLSKFFEAVGIAAKLVSAAGKLSVPDLEKKIFGARRYNTWSSANHVLSYLSYRGTVTVDSDGVFSLVSGLF